MKRIIFLLTFLLLLPCVLAGTKTLTLVTPATGIWVAQSNFTHGYNYTQGFNITWTHTDLSHGASCTLYIGTDSDMHQLTKAENVWNQYATKNCAQTSKCNFIMNHTITYNGTHSYPVNATYYTSATRYWTIKCCNATAEPGDACVITEPSIFYVYSQGPKTTINRLIGATNNTLGTTATATLEIKALHNQTTGLVCSLYTSTGTVNTSQTPVTVTNNTAKNITWTVSPDGWYNLTGGCSDLAGTSDIKTLTLYHIALDSTSPVITYDLPASGSTITVNYTNIRFNITELYLSHIVLNWNLTDIDIVAVDNCTISGANYKCNYSITNIHQAHNIKFNLTVNDTLNQITRTSTKTISHDWTTPNLVIHNFSLSSGTASYKLTVTELNPNTCSMDIYNRTDSLIKTTAGTLAQNSPSVTGYNCTGSFTASDLTTEGQFTVRYTINDTASKTFNTTKTGIYKKLYTGWNLVTYPDTNRSVAVICSGIQYCTYVSYYTALTSTFTTYATTTPGTNNGTTVYYGEAILVYVSADSSMIANNWLSLTQLPSLRENITVYDNTWTNFGLLYNTNLSTVYSVLDTGGGLNLSWASYFEADSQTFYTCSRSQNKCSGTATEPANILLYKGDAVWVLALVNTTINRSAIQ